MCDLECLQVVLILTRVHYKQEDDGSWPRPLQLVLDGGELWDQLGRLVSLRDGGIVLWKLPTQTRREKYVIIFHTFVKCVVGIALAYCISLQTEVASPRLTPVVNLTARVQIQSTKLQLYISYVLYNFIYTAVNV